MSILIGMLLIALVGCEKKEADSAAKDSAVEDSASAE